MPEILRPARNRETASGLVDQIRQATGATVDGRPEKHLTYRGIEAFSVHPGAIQTDLGRHLTEEDIAMFQAQVGSGAMPLKTIPAGAATQVLAATAPEGGAYRADCQICEIDDEAKSWNVVRSYAIDPEAADQLWRISEEMLGTSFDL